MHHPGEAGTSYLDWYRSFRLHNNKPGYSLTCFNVKHNE
jgi:hypothetical protein